MCTAAASHALSALLRQLQTRLRDYMLMVAIKRRPCYEAGLLSRSDRADVDPCEKADVPRMGGSIGSTCVRSCMHVARFGLAAQSLALQPPLAADVANTLCAILSRLWP